jgi:hypothetical protein
VFVGTSYPALGITGQAGEASVAPYTVPADVTFALDFVRTLERSGITVSEVGRSHLEATFAASRSAAMVRTNRGVVEVVFFPGENDAEKVQVREESPTNKVDGWYYYVIGGLETNGQAGHWQSPNPVYFRTHRNMFIVSWTKETDEAVAGAFGLQ